MSKKLFAIMTAVLMVMVAGSLAMSDNEDTDAAPGPAGSFNIYVYVNGVWEMHSADGYNAFEAFMNSSWATHCEAKDDRFIIGPPDIQYTVINKEYGTIEKFNGYENNEGSHWCTLAYVKDTNIGQMVWKSGSTALGWYKPFTDYSDYTPDNGTANIALYYGTEEGAETKIASLEEDIRTDEDLHVKALTNIDKTVGSVFEHKFFIKQNLSYRPEVSPGTKIINENYEEKTLRVGMVNNGFYAIGYGSDLMLALIDAVGSDNVNFTRNTSPVPGFENYGWMIDMFSLEKIDPVTPETRYQYWVSYTSSTFMGDSTNVAAPFATGAYSPLTNAPLVCHKMAFIFDWEPPMPTS